MAFTAGGGGGGAEAAGIDGSDRLEPLGDASSSSSSSVPDPGEIGSVPVDGSPMVRVRTGDVSSRLAEISTSPPTKVRTQTIKKKNSN